MRPKLRSLDSKFNRKFFTTNHIHLRTRTHKIIICSCHQNEFMKNAVQRFSSTNSWASDSTFKINLYGLPFYAAIVPNQDKIVILVFYMFYNNNMKQEHEDIAIEIILTYIFMSLKKIRIIECNSKC